MHKLNTRGGQDASRPAGLQAGRPALLCAHLLAFWPAGLLLLLGLVLAGCATRQVETPAQRLERIGSIAEVAAYTGAAYWLIDHPEDRPRVAMAASALYSLTSTNGVSPAALQQALLSLPMRELKSEKGMLLVGAAVLLYEQELGRITPIDQGPYVATVAGRVRAGLLRALEAPPAP